MVCERQRQNLQCEMRVIYSFYWQEFSRTRVNSHRVLAKQCSHGQTLFLSANRRQTGVCIFLPLPSQTIIKRLAESHRSCVFSRSLEAGVWNQAVTRLVSPGGCEGKSALAFLLEPGQASPTFIPCVDLSPSGLYLHLHTLSSLHVLVEDTSHGLGAIPV